MEVKSNEVVVLANTALDLNNIGKVIDIKRFSDVNKLFRVTGWILRFIFNLERRLTKKSTTPENVLTSSEINNVREIWIKTNQFSLVQNEKFTEWKNALDLFEDENGIIRSTTRLANANLPYATKNPILPWKTHRLSQLFVWDFHKKLKHSGERQTLTELRSYYWITNGKSFVKSILYRCVVCRGLNIRPYSYPKTPILPNIRLRDDTPFRGTGIDYFGPLLCKNVYTENRVEEDDMYNCFVALYTCASTRGVILELVHNGNGSSKTFINSFIRFIARIGCPQ